MWTDYDYARRVRPEPEFYLPRLIGGKLSVLVTLLVLYLCVCHQLVRHLSPSVVNLGMAHAEAVVMLTVFGGADTITTFVAGHRHYDLTRDTIAHADLFVRCWRAVLWRIECGTIWASLFVCAPPVIRLYVLSAWDLWRPLPPEPRPARKPSVAAVSPYAPPPAPHPSWSAEPLREAAKEPEPAIPPSPPEEAVPPATEVQKRPRKAMKVSPCEDDNPQPPSTPSAPLVQPGQVRKRRKPEA